MHDDDDGSIGKCISCGLPTFGIKIGMGDEIAFIPSLCELCLVEMSKEMMDETNPDAHLECPKCDRKVALLRKKECVDCYEARCQVTLQLPMQLDAIEPPLGWSDVGQRLRVDLDYEIVHRVTEEC